MHSLQQQTHTLTAEKQPSNQSFRTWRTNSLHQANLHKSALLIHRSLSPTSHPPSRRAVRERQWLAWRNRQQSDLHQSFYPRTYRTAACFEVCNAPEACSPNTSNGNPAENDAGLQAGSDQWSRGQHKRFYCSLASSASGIAPGCPRLH